MRRKPFAGGIMLFVLELLVHRRSSVINVSFAFGVFGTGFMLLTTSSIVILDILFALLVWGYWPRLLFLAPSYSYNVMLAIGVFGTG